MVRVVRYVNGEPLWVKAQLRYATVLVSVVLYCMNGGGDQ
jgi:hypothetical protein